MRGSAPAAFLALCLATGPLAAQSVFVPPSDRFRTVDYRADGVVDLACRPAYVTTIAFASDEEIQSIAIGDSGAWQATPSKSGNYLFLKPLASGTTNMTVVTNARTYVFELSVSGDGPYLVRFRYPTPAATASEAPPALVARYRVHGARALEPITIADDGTHVYIDWAPNLALPAVYSVGDAGKETLLNGAMRGGRYVIDSINPRLVFRRDKAVAFADRVPLQPKTRRR
ncbi:MAG TPA: TrbG/VirB9 family P-type conjugative transfer protein [Caulobacteraceae bacterium]|jgi:type IV secretion system protein VirB9|nr:TrbG/VirB9 family P-type conjugative transfer protein [Caulobacteraceae bacterium]